MNFTDLCNKFKYHAAVFMAEESPPQKVRKAMEEQGWRFGSSLTPEEAYQLIKAGAGTDSPVSAIPVSFPRVYSPEGRMAIGPKDECDPVAEQRYKRAVRETAARVYGVLKV